MTILTELKSRKQWINWHYGELRPNGKKAKVPLMPGTQRNASASDSATWGTYEDAEPDFRQGYVFTEEDGIAGIDLDNCIEDKKVLPWAKQIVETFNSYTEVSPSGKGLHILVRTSDLFEGVNRGNIEIYTHGRYFTVTGQHIAGPTVIEDRTELFNKFHAKVLSSSPQVVEKLPDNLVEDKWNSLAQGKWEGFGYPSQSEADLAYANHLRAETNKDRPRAEELFRESGLYRNERKLKMAFDVAFAGVVSRKIGGTREMGEIKEAYGDLEWTWEHWIPKGHVTMVAGAQGVGKSYFAATLIAAMAGYCPWPDSVANKGPTVVLLTETEGMKGEYVRRLETLGVNGSKGRVLFGPQFDAYEHEFLDDPGFALDLARIAAKDDFKMFVVDSLSGAHSMKENDSAMRKLLQTCTLWASELQIPIVLVHHERKRHEKEKARTTIDRVRGSSTITQFCRSIIGMWREGEDDTVRIEVIKSNFCAPPSALGMEISGGKPKFVPPPQVVVTGAPAIQEALDFLREVLGGGPVEIMVIREQAEEQGITKNTLYRAKSKLGLEKVKVLRRWCWVLPKEFTINIGP